MVHYIGYSIIIPSALFPDPTKKTCNRSIVFVVTQFIPPTTPLSSGNVPQVMHSTVQEHLLLTMDLFCLGNVADRLHTMHPLVEQWAGAKYLGKFRIRGVDPRLVMF